MKRALQIAALSGLLSCIALSPALGITNGRPDNGAHPYVGVALFHDTATSQYWLCSGTLLSPTVFLTAAHCTQDADQVWLWFTPNPVIRLSTLDTAASTGTAYTNPNFCLACAPGAPNFDYYDVGIVVLSTPVTLSTYGQLPQPGLVDTLAMQTPVDLVGYGVQGKAQIPGNPYYRWTGFGTRMYAPALLIASNDVISSLFLKLTANASAGKGGTCFGDSGGPDLLGGTNIVLAVNSYVNNTNCAGVTYSQRIDLPDILAWIQSFLA